ncbi:MAG: 3-dehydroquinate synthase II, partial [Methanocorpusculum sp.]|nr:3-dehydroquinate synthase II [Methanocorpusculum sp.]
MTPELSPILVRADISDDYETRKAIVAAALEAGFTTIIIRKSDSALTHLGRYTAILADSGALWLGGECIGTLCSIADADSMEKAYTIRTPYAVIDTADWRVIPLENLISRFQNTNTKLYACVKTPAEAQLARETMEVGSDGIAVCPDGPQDLAGFCTGAQVFPDAPLDEAVITSITPLSLGDRVCIDTCSLLEPGEGMFIGSSSSCLFLICSESFKSEYVNARPFRVNAGAVHSYILTPDGTTHYLSEVQAGTPLLSRKADGSLRQVSCGRVKIELRPMLLIEAEANGKTGSVIVQNAET